MTDVRTKHTFVCVICSKEHAKDWFYMPGHDDDPAMCEACFNATNVIKSVGDKFYLRDRATGRRHQIPAAWVTRAH